MKILYAIDDNISILKLYDALFLKDFRVSVFKSYEQCLPFLRRETPDVVICDLVLPTMNGWSGIEAMLEIRSNLNIIIASAMDSELQRLQAEKKGYFFWPKDGTHKVLEMMVHQLVWGEENGA